MKAIKVVGVIVAGLGTLFGLFLVLMWYGSLPPRRPSNISPAGIFIEQGPFVPFKMSTHGDWLDCWLDSHTNATRCRYADEKGRVILEDTFLAYDGEHIVPEANLRTDPRQTGHLLCGSTEKGEPLPVIYLEDAHILIPQSDYDGVKKCVDEWVYGRGLEATPSTKNNPR